MMRLLRDPVFYCIVGMVAAYIWVAYRWSRKHPAKVCPICNGTKRVPNEMNHFVVCLACDEEGRVVE